MNFLIPLLAIGAFALISTQKSAPLTSPKVNKEKYQVALFDSPGVSEASFDASYKLLANQPEIQLHVLTADDIRKGKLQGMDVVLFGGGGGSTQGKDLKESGRQKVRDYVANGGNYLGICAGSYLALQGAEQYNKLKIVAAQNFGEGYQRGTKDSQFLTNQNQPIKLHYENGPVFDPLEVEGLKPFQTLTTFVDDLYIKSKGTLPGETPGKPAIILSEYGKGKVLLFSPNPLLGKADAQHPELILNGISWLTNSSKIPQGVKFDAVFG